MLFIAAIHNKKNKEKGVTLLELLITIAVAGVLATLVSPNLASMVGKANLSQSLETLQASLQDGQRQAIRRSSPCIFNITKDSATKQYRFYYDTVESKSLSSSDPVACLSTVSKGFDSTKYGVEFPEGVIIETYNLPKKPLGDIWEVQFSYQGLPVALTDTATIVLSVDGTKERKCVVVSSILGIIKAGSYPPAGEVVGSPADSCTAKL